MFVHLPEGIHQVILHAEAGSGASVLIDDIELQPCGFFCEFVVSGGIIFLSAHTFAVDTIRVTPPPTHPKKQKNSNV